jgi:hypothetical protein
MARPSERANTERASRINAGVVGGGGKAVRIDIVMGSVYLAMVPCRDAIDKQPTLKTPLGPGLFDG